MQTDVVLPVGGGSLDLSLFQLPKIEQQMREDADVAEEQQRLPPNLDAPGRPRFVALKTEGRHAEPGEALESGLTQGRSGERVSDVVHGKTRLIGPERARRRESLQHVCR